MNYLSALRKARIAVFFSALMAAVFALSACNTLEGAGKDVERAGEEIQDATN